MLDYQAKEIMVPPPIANQSKSPLVSVIITVYNEQQWIRAAIDSVLAQSLTDFELVIVDDGSDDETPSILRSYSDPRLRIFHVDRLGRAAALAYATNKSQGQFIANLDADDECYPDRLEKQVAFLQAHPDHAWVGGGEDREDSQRAENYIRYYPEHDAAIRKMATKCIPYCHSAIMFTKSLIDSGLNYAPEQPFLIDFEFFIRVAMVSKVANLSLPVVKRRARSKSFFQRAFTTSEQNRELSRLCRVARRKFKLPIWLEVYPLLRTVYPLMPKFVKTGARRCLGLKELG